MSDPRPPSRRSPSAQDIPARRESALVQTFAELTDTLVDDFDVVDLLTLLADRCVDVLDAAAAGIMLADPEGVLRVVASSSDAMRTIQLFELETGEGPCPECVRTGRPVVNEHLTPTDPTWPRFARRAVEAGFGSAHALPMRLRGQMIGALDLFRADQGGLGQADLIAAQAFADVATIAVLQQRAAADAQIINEQLASALESRIVIEQAKGVLAERLGLPMEASFTELRGYARRHQQRLAEVARGVVDGSVPAPFSD